MKIFFTSMTRLSWTAAGLACLAAIVNGFTPMWSGATWVVAGLVLTSVLLSSIGLVRTQRQWRKFFAQIEGRAKDGD